MTLLNATVTPRQAALLLEFLARVGVDLAAASLHLRSFVRDPQRVANGEALAAIHAQLEAAAAGYVAAMRDGVQAESEPLPVAGRVLTVEEARDLLARCGVAVQPRRVRSLCESGELEARRDRGRWVIPERAVLEFAEDRRRSRGMPRGVRSGMVGA